MQFTKKEGSLLFNALMYVAYPEQNNAHLRTFPLAKQMDSSALAKLIVENLVDEKQQFIDGEIADENLTTTIKALAIECLNRDWTAFDAQIALELKSKLG